MRHFQVATSLADFTIAAELDCCTITTTMADFTVDVGGPLAPGRKNPPCCDYTPPTPGCDHPFCYRLTMTDYFSHVDKNGKFYPKYHYVYGPRCTRIQGADEGTARENTPAGQIVYAFFPSNWVGIVEWDRWDSPTWQQGGFPTNVDRPRYNFEFTTGDGDDDNASFYIEPYDPYPLDGWNIKAAEVFNYEIKNTYHIRLRLTTPSGIDTSWPVTIKIINLPDGPNAITLSNNEIDEFSPIGTTVGTLATTGGTGPYTYEIVYKDWATGYGKFTIDGSTLKTTDVFDYDDIIDTMPGQATSVLWLYIKSTDSESQTWHDSIGVVINNINEAPTDIKYIRVYGIKKNEPSGYVVGNLAAKDPDPYWIDRWKFELVAGAGDTDNGLFEIWGYDLISAAVFDGSQQSYSIRVRVTDSGNLTLEKSLTIQ